MTAQLPSNQSRSTTALVPISHSSASYSLAVGLIAVGTAAAVTLVAFHPTIVGELVTVLGFGLGFVSAIVTTIRLRITANAAASSSLDETEDTLQNLKRELTRFRYTEGTEEDGERALNQLKQIDQRFQSYEKLLREKLNVHELTFQRYFTAGETAKLAVCDNLAEIGRLLRNLSALRASAAEERLRELPQTGGTETEQTEANALRERLKLRDQDREKLQRLSAFNEKALTEIDRITDAVSQMKDLENHASASLEAALQDLEELAKRASKYN